MNAGLVSLMTRPGFMHHAELSSLYQPDRVGMMLDCSQGCIHVILKWYAALKGLMGVRLQRWAGHAAGGR